MRGLSEERKQALGKSVKHRVPRCLSYREQSVCCEAVKYGLVYKHDMVTYVHRIDAPEMHAELVNKFLSVPF